MRHMMNKCIMEEKYMKIMKKLAAFVLALCLVLPMCSMVSYAADGRVSFTDPDTKTGETVEVTCALRADGQGLESFDVTLEYDTEYLAFESGDEGVTKQSDGVLKYSGKSSGDARIAFAMKFVALKKGTTKIEVKESSGVTAGGETVDCTNGNSTVEIAQGTKEVELPATGASDVQVTVDGVSYNLSDNFKNSDIPAGFSETKLSYEGVERRFVQDATGSATLGYLVNAEGNGNFFLYNPSDSSFAAYVMVTVSPSTTIVLQKAEEGLKIPEGYQEVKLTVNENEFPAWQDVNNEGIYLVYAMNNNTGEKGFYQYDTMEESYQRFVTHKTEKTAEEESSKMSKIEKLIEKNLMFILIGIAAVVVVLLIVIIVLSAKLHHRNLELDDLYENGIDDIDDVPYEDSKSKSKKKNKKSKDDDYYDDDFESLRLEDDLYDDGLDDEYDDYYDDDYDDDYEDDYSDDYDDDDYDYDYDDEEDSFNFEDDDEDYEVDFIDLDR